MPGEKRLVVRGGDRDACLSRNYERNRSRRARENERERERKREEESGMPRELAYFSGGREEEERRVEGGGRSEAGARSD